MTEPREIDVEELAERLAEGVVVIDVREADEYDSGHVPGALFVPLSELEQRVDEVPSGEPVLRACNYLAPLGRDVTNIAGGTMAWIDSGRDVVTGMERG